MLGQPLYDVYAYTLGHKQPLWINNGSNLTVFGSFAVVVGLYKKHFNCTKKGCWRPALHQVKGTSFKTCHPHTTLEIHEQLRAEHAIKHPEQHEVLNRETPQT